MTAMAATVGVGNIVGVATAIYLGGPGAVFWMWMAGFFGMATKYGEAVLAVKYRVKDANGQMAGGPMYYLEHWFKTKMARRFIRYIRCNCSIRYWKWNAIKSSRRCNEIQHSVFPLDYRTCSCCLAE